MDNRFRLRLHRSEYVSSTANDEICEFSCCSSEPLVDYFVKRKSQAELANDTVVYLWDNYVL